MEMQGFDVIPDNTEDEVWIRDAEGELIRLEVADDADNDQA